MNEELQPVPCGCGGETLANDYFDPDECKVKHFVHCVKCGICSADYDTEAEAITAWNRAMGADQFREVTKKIERTAEVKYDYTSTRVYLANDAVGQFHPVCGNCKALVAKGWQYCTQCGARLIWGTYENA